MHSGYGTINKCIYFRHTSRSCDDMEHTAGVPRVIERRARCGKVVVLCRNGCGYLDFL